MGSACPIGVLTRKSTLGMCPKEGGSQIPLLGGSGSPGIVRAAMSFVASGSRIVEPVTEEDFWCAA
jgi:hypothetical protein